MIDVSSDGERTTIRLEGPLDGDTTSTVRSILKTAIAPEEPDRSVVVDMSRASDVTPVALAALIEDVEDVCSVRFRGLSRHALRILSYLMSDRSEAPRALSP